MPDRNANRWIGFWTRLGATGNPGLVFQEIASNYDTPPRAYHNLLHIAHCLDEFEPARRLADEVNAIEMAIWFHDIIYDSHAKDNEERSAEKAQSVIKSAELTDAFRVKVADLILATKHNAPPKDADSALLIDVDLSILGQRPEIFDEYERQIRREYDWVAEEAFVAGRSAVLKTFLDRPAIYSTAFFRNKYEPTARANLARSIELLKATH
jgi:predicted metal-dependent HD superfamily phosphohydrolase